jgi:hypothetical protein
LAPREAVGGVVIDDDDFVDEVRHGAEDLLDALLLVEAGDDDGDGLPFIHGKRPLFPAVSVFLDFPRVWISWK